ncbi:MAG: hypothetical protein RL095_4150, partial [Verrucomicrobiota bacterium]
AAHGFAEVVAVFAQILDAPVPVALGQLGDQRLCVPELTQLLRDDLFAFGVEEQMPVGVQDVDSEQREAAGAEAVDEEEQDEAPLLVGPAQSVGGIDLIFSI